MRQTGVQQFCEQKKSEDNFSELIKNTIFTLKRLRALSTKNV